MVSHENMDGPSVNGLRALTFLHNGSLDTRGILMQSGPPKRATFLLAAMFLALVPPSIATAGPLGVRFATIAPIGLLDPPPGPTHDVTLAIVPGAQGPGTWDLFASARLDTHRGIAFYTNPLLNVTTVDHV